MADNNSFFSKKIKVPGSFDGMFDGDGYNSVYVGGTEVARFDSQGIQLTAGTALRQGSAPAGGLVVNEDSSSSVSTPLTLVASQSGQVWFNSGSVKRSFVLPAAQAGLVYSFRVLDADGIRVQGVSESAKIHGTVATSLPAAWVSVVSTEGGYFESTQLGATARFECLSSTASIAWVAVTTGVWSPLI